ncbi:MAG: nitroreductase family protein [Pseudomonadota bacterium]
MELMELIKTRRSIRKFNPDIAVDEATVNKILEAGIWAPSAGNTQCWRFLVVRDKQIKKRLASEAGHQPFIASAPVVIVVCADLGHMQRSYGERGLSTYSLQDTAAAIENMLLTITELKLGCCWIGAFKEEEATKILNLPAAFRPIAILPIGMPAETPAPTPRRKIEEVTTYL